MKLLTTLTILFSLTSAYAAEEFGGITFHSSVEKNQVNVLKSDLRYIYQNPVSNLDKDFLAMTKMQTGDGKEMHNWILNRVRHIVGENFKLNDENIAISIRRAIFFNFPNTPFPDGLEKKDRLSAMEEEERDVKTVMSNIGTALYLSGKKARVPFGLKLDGEKVYVTSPRTGILQVGEGLFFKDFEINRENPNATSNSISRLGTLFHEARHSDGNGKGTGFLHKICPEGHFYAGYAACEIVGNGPYTLGGLAQRHLLQNCSDCSTEELTALSVKVLDSFSRVVNIEKLDRIKYLTQQIDTYKDIIKTYELLIREIPEIREKYQAEVDKLKAQVAEMEKELKTLLTQPEKSSEYDATPEGKFSEMTVNQSSKLMEKSLK
ncbi:hypothetical protein ACJVC5_02180 [Peredibacter sp. HCB2-198]|uniref:hypothetical protein n=1 Tax=Peredibacter sp. HCB2-198 TaxID=3383025 RepID=UPI0038B48D64